ncbi:LD-carboxypeptidase [Bacillus sp. AGMB 02131]|uniref:LD-carboxypeptidase n=1 Tax=Peribacillus faecalis TaxID=2772559 RepID=A0A927H9J6_9BACI|nr:LD-carboxypeptidase [Peribacillus faecalis]MBD3106959.1 LD-carboxypeptidase [Peribacillus faecalis]
MLTKPERLQKGDCVGVIAPGSPTNRENLEKGIAFLESLGLRVKIGRNIYHRYGYLAGADEERLTDLNEMFADPVVKAIFCSNGGYGTARIAADLDYDLIRRNPKIFWGYSDITFLHTSIRQKSGLVTFHGPMLSSDVGKDTWSDVSASSFRQLFNNENVVYDEHIAPIEAPVVGRASGEFVGGNLCLLVTTLGTPYEIETKDKILFIEDIHEEPRSVDRMLNQLWLAGKLQHIAGLAVGDFNDCEPEEGKPTLSLDEVLSYYIKRINRPTLTGLKIGHCQPHIAVPLGTRAVLNANQKQLHIESGIS